MAEDVVDVRITGSEKGIFVFYGLFADGVLINVETERPLLDILCGQVGISKNYLNDRVQTVFLNGRAVDDLAGEIVENNAVIALSAAMPGLVGAVFRKGGKFSSLRSVQQEPSKGSTSKERTGQVTLKLFNLIAAELGPDLLKNGILIHQDQLLRYVDWKRDILKRAFTELTVDGLQVELDDLAAFLEEADRKGHVRLFANVDQ